MNKESAQLLKKNIIGYILCGILLSGVEIAQLISATYFLENDVHYGLYLAAHIVLLLANVTTIITFMVLVKLNKIGKELRICIYAYSTICLISTCCISMMDVAHQRNGEFGYPIVFLCAIFAVAGLLNVNHIYYALITAILSVFVITIDYRYNTNYNELRFFGFLIAIFIALIIQYRNHQMSKQQNKHQETLELMSFIDELSGAYNRRALDTKLTSVVDNKNMHVMIADIDNFKGINDTMGHLSGDRILKDVANILKYYFADPVYRYGGDEFVIITTQNSDEILAKMAFVNKELERGNCQISVGIAKAEFGKLLNDCLSLADSALYQAKEKGKGISVVYGEDENDKKD